MVEILSGLHVFYCFPVVILICLKNKNNYREKMKMVDKLWKNINISSIGLILSFYLKIKFISKILLYNEGYIYYSTNDCMYETQGLYNNLYI